MIIAKMHSLRKISPKFTFPILYSIFNIPSFQINSNFPYYNLTAIQNFHLSYKINSNMKPTPSVSKTNLLSTLIQAQDPSKLTLEIENAINEKNLENAWRLYEKHLHLNGLPHKWILTKLISCLTETLESNYLQKACNIVNLAFDQKKFDFIESETLIYLSYILARYQMPVEALNIIRKLIKMESFPPISSLSAIVVHMSQTETGTFLASELILEISYIFQSNNQIDPRKMIYNKPLLLMKPNSFIFTLALTGCIKFNITKKAEQILDLIYRIGLKPGPDLLTVMAIVYERNGRRDDLRKLKRYIEEAIGLSRLDLMQFYECLFLCDLKFGDFNSCMDLVLDMLQKAKEAKKFLEAPKLILRNENDYKFFINQPINYVSFLNDAKYSRLENEAKELLDISLNRLRAQVDLVKIEHGILYPTDKLYAKLVRKLLEAGRIAELVRFLIRVSKLQSPVVVGTSVLVQVINACISLGLLDHAHDLLDEMRFSGVRVCSSVYSNLLMAYAKNNCQEEITTLLKDARQAGVQLDSNCYETFQSQISQNNSNLTIKPSQKSDNNNKSGDGASLMAKLFEEIKQNPSTDYDANDWNNVIHFFCKKKMMNDAKKAFNKMKNRGHKPNAQTYHSLITAYASIGGKYAEVANLWGEMKILSNSNLINFDQELLDSLLYCFVRGGFFLRAMEIIVIMEKNDMFIDKYKYRALWLKYHRTLYKGKAPKIQNEAQLIRREAALSFKRWIGLN